MKKLFEELEMLNEDKANVSWDGTYLQINLLGDHRVIVMFSHKEMADLQAGKPVVGVKAISLDN